jgi:hypothetical protein
LKAIPHRRGAFVISFDIGNMAEQICAVEQHTEGVREYELSAGCQNGATKDRTRSAWAGVCMKWF